MLSKLIEFLAKLTKTRETPIITDGQPVPPWGPLGAVDRDILTRTLWGEARGEPEEGQIAVVHVVRNRAIHRGTNAATECQRPWQFSCWNTNDPQRPKMEALARASDVYLRLAAVVDKAWTLPDVTGGARHYYAPKAMVPPGAVPKWARPPAVESARVGGHIFFVGVA